MHIGVSVDVEEVGAAEVLVAPAVARVHAGGVDDQLQATGAIVIDLEPAVDAVEVSLDLRQPPEIGDAELSGRVTDR